MKGQATPNAAAFAVTITVNTGQPLAGAVLFPVGFVLLTGVFALTPPALIDRRPGVTVRGVLRNWRLVFLGNLAGAVLVATMIAVTLTFGFSHGPDAIGQQLGSTARAGPSATPSTGSRAW